MAESKPGTSGSTPRHPTANIVLRDDSPLADGVYAALYVRPDGAPWPAAVSVGRRPTFYPAHGPRLLEAHLIGFTGELTGEEAEVLLLWYLRPQRSFGSAEELTRQLRRDIDAACLLLCEGLSAAPKSRQRRSRGSAEPRRSHRSRASSPLRIEVGEAGDDLVADASTKATGSPVGIRSTVLDAEPGVASHLGRRRRRRRPRDRAGTGWSVNRGRVAALGVAVAAQHVELVGHLIGVGGEQVARVRVRATRRSVLRSPLPPIRIGGRGWLSGRGEQIVSASW